VARVGDEAALRVERLGKPVEHLVQGLAQLAQLVVGPGDRDALVQMLLGHAPGRSRDPLEWGEHPAGHDPAEHRRKHEHAREGDEVLEGDLVERVAGLGWREGAVEVAPEEPVADEQEDARRQAGKRDVDRGETGPDRGPRQLHTR
jgi:hypothetical protein